MPDKLHLMQELFLVEASKYNVLPLDNTFLPRMHAPRPSPSGERNVFTYTGSMPNIPSSGAPNILNKSYTISADVDVPAKASGMIVTQGGRMGGYGLYLIQGKPIFLYNQLNMERFRWQSDTALTAGKHKIVFDFKYDGGGVGKGGKGTLAVDGHEVASRSVSQTIPFTMQWNETFDVGVDTGTTVDDGDYQVPFPFAGSLDKLTFELRPVALGAKDASLLLEKSTTSNSASE